MLKKIREYGVLKGFKIGRSKLFMEINKVFFYIFKSFPFQENSIILESEGDFCDNAYALYSYMECNGYLDKYKVIWLVDYPKSFMKRKNTIFCGKKWGDLHISTMYYLATSKFYIYDHNCLISGYRRRDNQRIIYLSHGAGYKAGKGTPLFNVKSKFDEMIATGNIPAELLASFWKCDINIVKKLGYPRLDYFKTDLSYVKEKFEDLYRFSTYKSILLWMPTFRQSISKELSEDYLANETGLPLFNTKENLIEFNDYLKEKNLLTILKVHHLQKRLSVFGNRYSNIIIIDDGQLSKMNIQLYQMVALMDALITDYSSISVDYMLLNRPIVYILDDYEYYNKSRGIAPSNAMNLMKGYHVYSIKELENSIREISHGVDRYREQRELLLPEFHTYTDGKSSRRILNHLGILK